jgi:hypothetical protein
MARWPSVRIEKLAAPTSKPLQLDGMNVGCRRAILRPLQHASNLLLQAEAHGAAAQRRGVRPSANVIAI